MLVKEFVLESGNGVIENVRPAETVEYNDAFILWKM